MKKNLLTIILALFVAFGAYAQKGKTTIFQADPNPASVTSPKDATIHWDGDFSTSLGAGGGTMICLTEYTEADLAAFGVFGGELTQLEVYLSVGYTQVLARVYDDNGGVPGTVLYEEDITASCTADQWNTATLTTSVTLDQKVYIGYHMTYDVDTYPAGVDAGPANPKGDWYSLDEAANWGHLGDIPFGNWNIRGFATSLPGLNVGVSALVSPMSGGGLTNAETVTVTIMNSGDQDVTTFDVSFDVNSSGSPVTETWNGTLTAGTSMDYTFTATADLSAPGDYVFDVCVAAAGDITAADDCLQTTVSSFVGCEHTLTLFDSYGDGWNGNTCTVTVNGVTVLDGVTCNGAETTHTFFAETGDAIQYDFWADGSWIDECAWIMYDGEGTMLFQGDATDGLAHTENATAFCPGGVIQYDVTFNCDMNAPITAGTFVVGTDQLWLAGSMNTWTEPGLDAAMEMTDGDADGIYTVILTLDPGTYDYKYFQNAGWTGGEWAGGLDRTFDLVDMNLTLNDYWGGYVVDFLVTDGTNPLENALIGVDPAVKAAWQANTDVFGTAMIILPDGDYTYTVTLAGYNDVTGLFTVLQGNYSVPEIIMTPLSVSTLSKDIEIYPNPSNGVFNVEASDLSLDVIDVTGKTINTVNLTGNTTVEINNAGVYFFKFSNGVVEKVIVK